MHVDTPYILENVHGRYKAFGLQSACTSALGLCQIPVIKTNCASECAYWTSKGNPCETVVTPADAAKNLCSVFDPNNDLVKMGMTILPKKTCTALHACNMAKAGSKCSTECAALQQQCAEKKVALKPECIPTTRKMCCEVLITAP